jgi:hypothetical protein
VTLRGHELDDQAGGKLARAYIPWLVAGRARLLGVCPRHRICHDQPGNVRSRFKNMSHGCIDGRVPLDEGHLRLLAPAYIEHWHRARNQQGLDNFTGGLLLSGAAVIRCRTWESSAGCPLGASDDRAAGLLAQSAVSSLTRPALSRRSR